MDCNVPSFSLSTTLLFSNCAISELRDRIVDVALTISTCLQCIRCPLCLIDSITFSICSVTASIVATRIVSISSAMLLLGQLTLSAYNNIYFKFLIRFKPCYYNIFYLVPHAICLDRFLEQANTLRRIVDTVRSLSLMANLFQDLLLSHWLHQFLCSYLIGIPVSTYQTHQQI